MNQISDGVFANELFVSLLSCRGDSNTKSKICSKKC